MTPSAARPPAPPFADPPFADPLAAAAPPLAPPTDPVPDGGYRWWYLDGTSDDGRHALTAIVFIGSVFSPWYRHARRRGPVPALEHAAVNLALYGPTARWCMTERDARAVSAGRTSLAIGASTLDIGAGREDGGAGATLRLDVVERGMPLPQRLCGRIEVDIPAAPAVPPLALDAAGDHEWQPIAPQTRIRVRMSEPALAWEGIAYVDTNRGAVPLEESFRTWHWSRSHAADGSTRVRYDVVERGGHESSRTLDIAADGTLVEGPRGVPHVLRPTRWFGMPRPTRLSDGATAEGLETLENAPFYSRSRFVERLGDERRSVVHESLDMDRFVHPLVQCLLPFRTPRRRTSRRTGGGTAPA